jgi:hypothetical protein
LRQEYAILLITSKVQICPACHLWFILNIYDKQKVFNNGNTGNKEKLIHPESTPPLQAETR